MKNIWYKQRRMKIVNSRKLAVIFCIFFFSCEIPCLAQSGEAVKSKSDNKANLCPITVTAAVDPRVELMSVIFNLAGNSEYNQCRSMTFMKNLNEYFDRYRNHPAVQMAKELGNNRGIGYDAVMNMAIHIKDVNSCAELVGFQPRPDSLDSRWNIDEAREFLAKCRDFVNDTNFPAFLKINKLLYDQTRQNLQHLIDSKINLGWFNEFFGPRDDVHFNLIISILNGPCNYGVKIKTSGRTEIYCILGAWEVNWFGWGYPQFSQDFVTTIVHEFSHSYCNTLVDKHINDLRTFGEEFYPKVEKKMKGQAYGSWQTMMYESMVRACEVRYTAANSGPKDAERIADYQVSRGFLWTKELSDVLAQYENHRDKYPDFESFFPKVVEFFQSYPKSKN
jgi:hypothetical protein